MMKIAALLLLSASADAATLKKQPVMKLRGGISGVDGQQVATIVAGISAANGVVMGLSPKKAGEMYGITASKWTDFFSQWSGYLMFGQALAALLAFGGMDFSKAMAWGMVPACVSAFQDFLNDRNVGEMGMNEMSRYMPPLVNIVLCLGLFGKLSFLDADMSLKVTAVWNGINGLFGYFANSAWLEQWGGSGPTVVDTGMSKLMATCLTGYAILAGAPSFLGKTPLEAFGLMMIGYFLSSIDGVFVSKSIADMGVEPAKPLFWAVLQAATGAAIFL